MVKWLYNSYFSPSQFIHIRAAIIIQSFITYFILHLKGGNYKPHVLKFASEKFGFQKIET